MVTAISQEKTVISGLDPDLPIHKLYIGEERPMDNKSLESKAVECDRRARQYALVLTVVWIALVIVLEAFRGFAEFHSTDPRDLMGLFLLGLAVATSFRRMGFTRQYKLMPPSDAKAIRDYLLKKRWQECADR